MSNKGISGNVGNSGKSESGSGSKSQGNRWMNRGSSQTEGAAYRREKSLSAAAGYYYHNTNGTGRLCTGTGQASYNPPVSDR